MRHSCFNGVLERRKKVLKLADGARGAGRFFVFCFPVGVVGWRRLWRLSRAQCTFFFVQGGSNIIKARRTCRYDHPVAFGCHRGVDPKVGFRVNFICERLTVRLTAPPDPWLNWIGINADVWWCGEISRLCTPTSRLKVPLGIGEERHQKGGWSSGR